MHELDDLAERFWAWRARQQPRTRDDIPRLDRPAGWLPEVDPALARPVGRARYEWFPPWTWPDHDASPPLGPNGSWS